MWLVCANAAERRMSRWKQVFIAGIGHTRECLFFVREMRKGVQTTAENTTIQQSRGVLRDGLFAVLCSGPIELYIPRPRSFLHLATAPRAGLGSMASTCLTNHAGLQGQTSVSSDQVLP